MKYTVVLISGLLLSSYVNACNNPQDSNPEFGLKRSTSQSDLHSYGANTITDKLEEQNPKPFEQTPLSEITLKTERHKSVNDAVQSTHNDDQITKITEDIENHKQARSAIKAQMKHIRSEAKTQLGINKIQLRELKHHGKEKEAENQNHQLSKTDDQNSQDIKTCKENRLEIKAQLKHDKTEVKEQLADNKVKIRELKHQKKELEKQRHPHSSKTDDQNSTVNGATGEVTSLANFIQSSLSSHSNTPSTSTSTTVLQSSNLPDAHEKQKDGNKDISIDQSQNTDASTTVLPASGNVQNTLSPAGESTIDKLDGKNESQNQSHHQNSVDTTLTNNNHGQSTESASTTVLIQQIIPDYQPIDEKNEAHNEVGTHNDHKNKKTFGRKLTGGLTKILNRKDSAASIKPDVPLQPADK